MTKAELIKSVAEAAGISQDQARKALNAFQKTILVALKADSEVVVLELGKFKIAQRSERQGVNPRDPKGPKVLIPARKVPQLKASKKLKDFVAGDSGIDSFPAVGSES